MVFFDFWELKTPSAPTVTQLRSLHASKPLHSQKSLFIMFPHCQLSLMLTLYRWKQYEHVALSRTTTLICGEERDGSMDCGLGILVGGWRVEVTSKKSRCLLTDSLCFHASMVFFVPTTSLKVAEWTTYTFHLMAPTMVGACAAKRRHLLGDKLYGIWGGWLQTKR